MNFNKKSTNKLTKKVNINLKLTNTFNEFKLTGKLQIVHNVIHYLIVRKLAI